MPHIPFSIIAAVLVLVPFEANPVVNDGTQTSFAPEQIHLSYTSNPDWS